MKVSIVKENSPRLTYERDNLRYRGETGVLENSKGDQTEESYKGEVRVTAEKIEY